MEAAQLPISFFRAGNSNLRASELLKRDATSRE
jgi:hypothetical protein